MMPPPKKGGMPRFSIGPLEDPDGLDEKLRKAEMHRDGERAALIYDLEREDREASWHYSDRNRGTFVNKFMLFHDGIRHRDKLMEELRKYIKGDQGEHFPRL